MVSMRIIFHANYIYTPVHCNFPQPRIVLMFDPFPPQTYFIRISQLFLYQHQVFSKCSIRFLTSVILNRLFNVIFLQLLLFWLLIPDICFVRFSCDFGDILIWSHVSFMWISNFFLSYELANSTPQPLLQPRCTRLSTYANPYSVQNPYARVKQCHRSFIFFFTGQFWNRLCVCLFLPAYDLQPFRRGASRHLSNCSWSSSKLPF